MITTGASATSPLIGYPDLYTFSKMFKRGFGLSPRHFRRLVIR